MAAFYKNTNFSNSSDASVPLKAKDIVTVLYRKSDKHLKEDLVFLDVADNSFNLRFVTPARTGIDSDGDVYMSYIIYDPEDNEIIAEDTTYYSTNRIASNLVPLSFIKNARSLFAKEDDSLLDFFKNVHLELERNRNYLKLQEKKEEGSSF